MRRGVRAGTVRLRGIKDNHTKEVFFIERALGAVSDVCQGGRHDLGGGMAMLPILQREVVENKGWATDEELTDYFAIGQCTPGSSP